MKTEKAKNENYHSKMMKLESVDIWASCKEIFKLFYTMEYPYFIFLALSSYPRFYILNIVGEIGSTNRWSSFLFVMLFHLAFSQIFTLFLQLAF